MALPIPFLRGTLLLLAGCSYLVHDQGRDFERAEALKPLQVPPELRRVEPPVLVGIEPPEEERPAGETAVELPLPYPVEESWPRLLQAVAKLGGEVEDVDLEGHRFKARFIGAPARTLLEEIGLIFRSDPLKGRTYLMELRRSGEGTRLRIEVLGRETIPREELHRLAERLSRAISRQRAR